MILRTLVTGLYLAAVAVAFLLQFVYPEVAVYLILGLLAWFIVSLFVYRMPAMSRPVGGATPTPAGPLSARPAVSAGSSAPLPSAGGMILDFCPYCAHPVEPGTPVCPECQHRIPVF